MSFIVTTSNTKQFSYKFNPKSGRRVHLDGKEFLVVKISNVWRVLAPVGCNRYILANRPFVYDKRSEAGSHLCSNKQELMRHISDIQVKVGDVIVVKPKLTMLVLAPTTTMRRFGHVIVFDKNCTRAYHKQVPAQVFGPSCSNIYDGLKNKGYTNIHIVTYAGEINYKKKLKGFYEWCNKNKCTVRS